jgi:uncharacterized protein
MLRISSRKVPRAFCEGVERGMRQYLAALLETSRIDGARVHDARIAAICRAAGVREIWSADRDFSRMPGVVVRDPL